MPQIINCIQAELYGIQINKQTKNLISQPCSEIPRSGPGPLLDVEETSCLLAKVSPSRKRGKKS